VASRGDQWARTAHVSTAEGTRFGYQTSSGQAGAGFHGANGTIANTTNGVYAGHDGDVYRKNSDGSWSQYNNGNWNSVDTAAAKQQAQQNVQSRQQNANSQNLGAASRTAQQAPSGTGQPLGASQNERVQSSQNARQGSSQVSPNTLQGLNDSAQARQLGQQHTQEFQRTRGRMGGGGGFHRRR